MNFVLPLAKRNLVLQTMAKKLHEQRSQIIATNKGDMDAYHGKDIAMKDRLKVDTEKVDAMILSVQQLAAMNDPLGVERFQFTHENGMQVSNKTAPFGTVLIIYESRPDVTIEAAGIAFKSGNRILLKGGKEALQSNLLLVSLWHSSLKEHNITSNWIEYLQFSRNETQSFLENPTEKVDLIVPRGGEQLIRFVKKHATCPVIVSGRGNNFIYIDKEADIAMALNIITNAKTTKISACNALDKVLIHNAHPNKASFLKQLIETLKENQVTIWGDVAVAQQTHVPQIETEMIWYEEFLDYKIVLGEVSDMTSAIKKINTYGGGHSAAIITENKNVASTFMTSIDAAAVYHNASTRFTDGGEFGLGGELAISTDKLHQRGPIGLQHLVTNKWYVHGTGQIR